MSVTNPWDIEDYNQQYGYCEEHHKEEASSRWPYAEDFTPINQHVELSGEALSSKCLNPPPLLHSPVPQKSLSRVIDVTRPM
jgi:hypothetical protein